MRILCECESETCDIVIFVEQEDLKRYEKIDTFIISNDCLKGAEPTTDKLFEEHETYKVYTELVN